MKPAFGRTRPVRARLIAVVLFLALTGSLLPAAPPAAALTSTPQPTATPRPTRTPTPTVTATPTLPATEPDLIAAGHEALLASNFARAEEAFQAAIKLDSTSSAALVGLSRTYAVQMGRQREALAAAEQAVELDPAYVPGWIALADAQIRLNLVTDALASAEKAVESVGTATIAAEAQAALANAYRIDSRMDDALAAAARAVELDGQSAVAYAALGLVHQDRGDLGRAINALKRAVELEPQFVWWRLLQGMAAQCNRPRTVQPDAPLPERRQRRAQVRAAGHRRQPLLPRRLSARGGGALL